MATSSTSAPSRGSSAPPATPSGLALRVARVLGHRDDKRADEAETLDHVRTLAR